MCTLIGFDRVEYNTWYRTSPAVNGKSTVPFLSKLEKNLHCGLYCNLVETRENRNDKKKTDCIWTTGFLGVSETVGQLHDV